MLIVFFSEKETDLEATIEFNVELKVEKLWFIKIFSENIIFHEQILIFFIGLHFSEWIPLRLNYSTGKHTEL